MRHRTRLRASDVGIPSASALLGTPPAGDQANYVETGTITATGQTGAMPLYGQFNLAIYGSSGPNGSWSATVRLEKSYDGGTTWIVAGIGATAQAVWNTPNTDVSAVFGEPERGVLYRLNCTAYISGTINWRVSASGLAAMTWGVNV